MVNIGHTVLFALLLLCFNIIVSAEETCNNDDSLSLMQRKLDTLISTHSAVVATLANKIEELTKETTKNVQRLDKELTEKQKQVQELSDELNALKIKCVRKDAKYLIKVHERRDGEKHSFGQHLIVHGHRENFVGAYPHYSQITKFSFVEHE